MTSTGRNRSTEVEKLIPLIFDTGNLSANDINPLATEKITNEFLKTISRDNAQLLLNEIFSLPVVSSDDGVFAKLPEPSSKIPREKPLAKVKAKTKWEKFADVKGIQNRKRSAMVFDEAEEKYKPRYGYKSKANDSLKDWCIEVPANADPFEDQYQKRKDQKKDKISKNEARRQKNLKSNQ